MVFRGQGGVGRGIPAAGRGGGGIRVVLGRAALPVGIPRPRPLGLAAPLHH